MKRPSAGDRMPLDNMLSGSLQSWLDHELEVRGIDAMVYTRYILSILQTDSFEAELGEADFFPPSRKGTVSASCSIPGVVLTKNYYQKGRNSEKKFTVCQNMDSEQRKKSAAVECLLSVSDEDSGIVGLVEELYLKIKAQVSKAEHPVAEVTVDTESSDSVISTSPEDPAERYYAAFPALSDSGDIAKPLVASDDVTCVWPNVGQLSPLASVKDKPETGYKESHWSGLSNSPSRRERPKHQECCPTSSGMKKPASNKNVRVAPCWDDVGRQKQMRGGSQFFRCGSQDRVIKKSPKMSRKKSWPDFERHSQPPFVVPKMPMQSKPPIMVAQGGMDSGVKTTPCRISLQEIFGTEQVREIVPCKTLVVDGQLVRLCATSVNSNNLEKTANVKLHEAPMEELVALKLQQEFQMLSEETQPRCLAGNEEEEEEVTWYTEPIGHLMAGSPQPKLPIFQRNPSEIRRVDNDAKQVASLSATPTCMTLWEDVLDENGVYTGARLSQPCTEPKMLQGRCLDESELEDSSVDSDYVDMTVATHLLHDLFDEAPETEVEDVGVISQEEEINHREVVFDQQGAGVKQKNVEHGETSLDRLNVFKIISCDAKNIMSCAECGQGEDSNPCRYSSPIGMGEEYFVSQYKGCLMPEITQNKVPDDRPLFFVGDQELNNNNSEHTKVGISERWPPVDNCNNDVMYNLFPSFHTSFVSTTSVLVPGYSSIWSVCDGHSSLCIGNACTIGQFPLSGQSKQNMQVGHCIFSIGCQSSWHPIDCNIPASGTSIFRHSAAWQNDIWSDTLMVSPHKLWDVNNVKFVDTDNSVGEMANNYLFNLGFEQEGNTKSDVEFIEGGLYGGTLNSDDAWSTTRSDCSDDEGICDADLTWNDLLSHRESMFQSNSAIELGAWAWNGGGSKMSGSMELLPSETSAFSSEALPPRLPHVQSEPSISQRQLISKPSTKKHRLVQVKHLYKPDTSILKTLGLDSDNDDDYKSDGVKYSPNCHFRPIRTPLNQTASSQHVVSIDDVYIYNDFIPVGGAKKDDDEETATLTGSVMSSSAGSDSYQLYRGDETHAVTFVPRFKLFKQHKLIQTGEHEQDAVAELEQGLSERLLVDMKRVLTIEEEGEELDSGLQGDLTMRDLDRSLELATHTLNGSSSSGTAEDAETIKSVLSTPTPQTIARLWCDNEGQPDFGDNADVQDLQTALPSVNSIWSYDFSGQQSQKHVLNSLFSLPKEGSMVNLEDFSGKEWLFGECLQNDSESQLIAKEPVKGELSAACVDMPDQYIPDVLIEVCASVSSSGMTPGSLPDILLHDCIISEKNPSSADGAEKLGEVKKIDVRDDVIQDHPVSVSCDPNSDNSGDFSAGGEKKGGESDVLPNYVPSDSYNFDYPEWDVATVDSVHDSADEQEPEWLQYDDNVFSDSGEMMFPMDPDFPTDQSGNGSSSGSPVNVTSSVRTVKPPEVPLSRAFYSSDLERSWLQDDVANVYKAARTSKSRNGSNSRPCTFFLEGHCHRVDCRFLHDMSQITCRFWEEGECFKGQSCPFLHGHISTGKKSLDLACDEPECTQKGRDDLMELYKTSTGEFSAVIQQPAPTSNALQCPSRVHSHLVTSSAHSVPEQASMASISQPLMVKRRTESYSNQITCKTNY